jgi:N-acetylglucosamine-6-sulfatase
MSIPHSVGIYNFTNTTQPGGAAWVSQLSQQNRTNIDYNDEWYRNRLRTLQAVDEMVAELVARLDHHGILEETYLIFTTDNGYHIGQHRLQPGKQCSYKEDINIPFLTRGPGVPKNHTSHVVTSHTDLAATFLEIAGAPPRPGLDGEAMPLTSNAMAGASIHHQEHVNVEMWGIIMSEGKYGADLHNNHTYKTLRIIGEGYSYRYTVWCSGEHELYDLQVRFSPPHHPLNLQTNNLPPGRSPRTHQHPPLILLPIISHQPNHQHPPHAPRYPPHRAQNLQRPCLHAPMGENPPKQQRPLPQRRREPEV